MRKKTKPTTAVYVSLGINADLSHYPERPLLKLDTPIYYADQMLNSILISNHSKDRTYSPAGKAAMTMQLPGDTYDFWKTAKETGSYEQDKEKLRKNVISAISTQIPEITGNVEVCDVATPLTYERYCDNWKGSWMTEIKADLNTNSYPPTIDGIDGLYLAGHRMMPPGGLPTTIMTARTAVQRLCRDFDYTFVSED
jgi:phytoene dehydrogenase-like protein